MGDLQQQHALYRFYGDDGRLLYVGITKNPGQRFDQHSDTKSWWPEVRGISVEWCANKDAARSAERRAIEIERPAYNIQRPPINKARQSAAVPIKVSLAWICDECRTPIGDGDGYIHASHREIHEREQARREWDKSNPPGTPIDIGTLMQMPDPARWQVHHRKCDPEPAGSDYWIDVARARTHARLLSWTAHLMEKNWLKHTDWDRLIRRMAAVDA